MWYFDITSMVLYSLLGLLSMWAMQKVKIQEFKTNTIQPLYNKYYITWSVFWIIIAVFRKVAFRIGGTDAENYIGFFEKCTHPNVESFYSHFYDDICYRWVNQLAYAIYPDYHIFFFITYGFFVFSIIYFCNYFVTKKCSFVPFVLLFYLFLRGFNTIRSNFAISVLMVACVFLLKKKYYLAVFIAIISVLFHKSSALFALVIPFCWYFRKNIITLKLLFILLAVSICIVSTLQLFAINFITSQEVDGAYQSYISMNMGSSFWEGFWKIAFEQMLLGAFMALYYKKIKDVTENNDNLDAIRIKTLWNICIFDMLLIPICFGLHIWRGYEYFYVARLAMWGCLIYIWLLKFKQTLRPALKLFLLLCFISWMIFRVYNTWEDSGLMPYIFEPFN